MSIKERIKEASTLENAIEWNNTQEKWMYCTDMLEMYKGDRGVSNAVESLERNYERMLKKNGIEVN